MLVSPWRAAAEDAALAATLTCAPAGEPGRVRCEVDARVDRAQIRWADVEIVGASDLAAPLKGRIGPRDATTKDISAWRFALALVAKRNGTGEILARVRAVVCTPSGAGAAEACVPLIAEMRGEVRVGR